MKIVFTGGGTAGHILPNIALIEEILATRPSWSVVYLGSKGGLEKELLSGYAVPFYSIYTGKLRRYFSLQNVLDGFKFIAGIVQSLWYLYKIKPAVIFSKGGYVGLPVTIAAKALKVPVIVHESDLSPGLANRLAFPWAAKILLAFQPEVPTTKAALKAKTKVVGLPMRQGFKHEGLKASSADYWFNASASTKPMLLIFGGSLGAAAINEAVRTILPQLLKSFRVLHVCGHNGVDATLNDPDYKQYEFIGKLFPAAIKAADVIVSRAGATSIYEFLYLNKLHILVPLETNSSRGDQLINARYFENKGSSVVLKQGEWLNKPTLLLEKLAYLKEHQQQIQDALHKLSFKDATPDILDIIAQTASVTL